MKIHIAAAIILVIAVAGCSSLPGQGPQNDGWQTHFNDSQHPGDQHAWDLEWNQTHGMNQDYGPTIPNTSGILNISCKSVQPGEWYIDVGTDCESPEFKQRCNDFCSRHRECCPNWTEVIETNNILEIKGLPACGTKYDFFTVLPLRLSDFVYISPLGGLNPSGHTFPTDHIYLYLVSPGSGSTPSKVNVYAPGDIMVTAIATSTHLSKSPQYTDYGVHFSACEETEFLFGHMSEISPKLLVAINSSVACDEYETGGELFRNCNTEHLRINLTAGELMGATGGNQGQYALDMNAYDTRANSTYANTKRWSQSMLPYAACPLDYFASAQKAQLEPLLGNGATKRTVEPICGSVAQDVPGTAQGIWFFKGSNSTNEDQQLALVFDNVEVNPVFSVGVTLTGLNTGVYAFTSTTSGQVNRQFKDVTADGKIYCYEIRHIMTGISPGTIILQMPNSTTLHIEKRLEATCGSGPWTFSSNAVDYER